MRPGVLEARVQGLALIGPGLPGWAESLPVLRGQAARVAAPTSAPTVACLPPAERRRAGLGIRLAVAAAEAACAHAGADPKSLGTVFTASHGDGGNCHQLCDMLAGHDRLISPTRFTNSVHNAAAGYWHIAVGAMTPSTSIAAHDGSFAAGLLEAMMQLAVSGQPQLLVASESPYPEPLNAVRPIGDLFAVALVLSPVAAPGGIARLRMSPSQGEESRCDDPDLDALRLIAPAARALPLLAALARADALSAAPTIVLPWRAGHGLAVTVGTPGDPS